MSRFLSAAACLLSAWQTAGRASPLGSREAAEALNSIFTSSSDTEGVYMSSADRWNLWCGGECWKGDSSCHISTTFGNLKIGVNDSKFFMSYGCFYQPCASGGDYRPAGFVFNSATVERQLASCYWIGNGGARWRYNHGCGCYAGKGNNNCASPHSAWANVGPDGREANGDSPFAKNCQCKPGEASPFCFWRGPAYNVSTGTWGGDEIQQFVDARSLVDSKDHGRWPMWDEVVLNGYKVQSLMATDPASVVTAIYYNVDPAYPGLANAKTLQQEMERRFGVVLPIIGIDHNINVSTQKGPFVEYQPAASEDAPPLVI